LSSYIALLRGINVGGNKKVAMSDLIALAADLGFENARTLLQSGNLVFSAAGRSADVVEALLEKALAKKLDLVTRVFVRPASDWIKIVAANPFLDEAERDPGHLALMLLKDKTSPKALVSLKGSIVGREYFEAHGREIYAFYPDGFGTSKFTTALIDRKLETTVTARNWNTVLKIAKAMQG
jgi:uncharacterized protein (DUF1697 family)